MNRDEKPATHGGVLVELPLGDAASTFKLEKAVCSHGLFMMAPNRWDPLSKTLQRPLRLAGDETSYIVHISHPLHSPQALCLRVFGTDSLSPQQQHALLEQVRRMLRLSTQENMRIKEFHEVHEIAKERGFGRVFRSPTLFEDMIKCILLCNCQWSRTLSMAEALCELQLELQHPLFSAANLENKTIIPRTPAGKESKKKFQVRKCSKNLADKYEDVLSVQDTGITIYSAEISEYPIILSSDVKEQFHQECKFIHKSDSSSFHNIQPLNTTEGYLFTRIANFPSPRELASLDEKFLAKRCNLGYRAGRIINLARKVFENKIDLREFEYASADTLSLSDYNKLAEKLKVINGFGPFTCSNVLMCMGFYHVIPTDSETIRHLKQVHAKSSTVRTVQRDVEVLYGKYAPFQFLAYWSEMWHFYEEWFGNPSEMPGSHYKLITASNMRHKTTKRSKRTKLFPEIMHDDLTERSET